MTGGVAIVGMSCLFPGASDVDAYWRNILGKVDAVADPPEEAWDAERYHDPAFADADKVYCRRGGYLGSLGSFDPLAHGIPPSAVGGEPDQWLALQLASDALADARCTDLPPEVRARTGVVLGKGTYLNGGNAIAVQRGLIVEQTLAIIRRLGYADEQIELLRAEMKRSLPPIEAETVPGLIPNVIVGRIANRLDLMGPTYTVDAACASSLVAVDLAMRDLRDGACDLVIAGGSQVWMPVPVLNVFCKLGALSRTERIRPFDAGADGTLLGEGIGMIVLKRAEDAARDGDRVYAVIRGVGVASDGRGVGVMAPRVEGEELALKRAYDAAGVSPRTIGLIEAHGTATPVGDVVEIQALHRVLGPRDEDGPWTALGTVKSMISHTIPASGIAGLIKLALALHHRVLPPTLHCDTPNPKLELETTPLYVNTETRPWIHGAPQPRRAGINAFGFGGINAHAVLEEADGAALDHLPPWDSEVCILEGDSVDGLRERAERLATALDGASFGLTDLAFTLAGELGRCERPVRLAIVAASLDDLREKLARAAERLAKPGCRRIKGAWGIYFEAEPLGREGKVALLFPGEGAQYPSMLADLCLRFPEVREAFDQADRAFVDHPRGHVLSDWVFPRPAFSDGERAEAERRLMQMDTAVEAVVTANHAVHGLLLRLGLRADACVGHSTGELSAARAAGALALDADERMAAFSQALYRYYADALARDDVPRAVLLAIAADRERVEAIAREAGGDLYVAMDNCPHQVVLVGEADAAERALAIVAREGLIHERLPYDRAVHTPLFAPFIDDLRETFAAVGVSRPETTLYSCAASAPYPSEPEAIRATLVDHGIHPVEFRRTIETLHGEGFRVFVEAGPRGNLTAFVEDILRGRPFCAVPADVQRRSGTTQLNHLVGMLAAHDVELDVSHLFAHRRPRRVDWEAAEPAGEPAPTARVALSMGWPALTISPEVAERVAEGRAAPAGGNGATPVDGGRVDVGGAAPVGADWATSVGGDPLEPVGGRQAAGSAEAAAAMDAHLATMDQFLELQEQVMSAFFAGPAIPAYPLLGDIVSHAPGAELVAERVFDPAEDLYLGDHTLSGLPIMPLTMSLEALAAAAAALVPELHVVGLRNVQAHRWLAWEDGPLTLRLTARRDDRERVRVELRNLADEAPAVEATVLLADAYPNAPAPRTLADGRPSTWRPERLYTDGMFHGPRWRGVRAIERTGAGGAEARLQVLPFDDFFATEAARFVLDPVVLDAAGQVIGFWTAEHLDTANVIFPFRLGALDIHCPPRPAGEAIGCTAAIELAGDALVRSDIDVVDADGRLWMRLTGWEDKRFDVPSHLRGLVVTSSEPAPMSETWDIAPACRRMRTALPADGALWKRIWARRVLSPAERERLAALRRPEPRQLEWLGARTAAKEAVQLLLERQLDLAEIEIDADERGRPHVRLPNAPVVSLSHTNGLAVALAGPPGARVGIDVEYVRPVPDLAFTDAERELLSTMPEEWALRCWCAKEAVSKALGTGGPVGLTIAAIDGERVTVNAPGEPAPIVAHTRREDDLIVATTGGPPDDG